jgi:hypothetical protein
VSERKLGAVPTCDGSESLKMVSGGLVYSWRHRPLPNVLFVFGAWDVVLMWVRPREHPRADGGACFFEGVPNSRKSPSCLVETVGTGLECLGCTSEIEKVGHLCTGEGLISR